MGGNDSRWVEADLGRVDMRVYTQIGRGIAALVYEAKVLLAECWRLVRLSGSAGTATECHAHNKGKKQGPQSTAVRSVSHVPESALIFCSSLLPGTTATCQRGWVCRTSHTGRHRSDECLSGYLRFAIRPFNSFSRRRTWLRRLQNS